MKFKISPKRYEMELNLDDAIIYCQFLECDGFGWRLPNKDELNEIYLIENDFEKEWYWSSTIGLESLVWLQDFYNGFNALSPRFNKPPKNFSTYVRAIRDL